MRSRLYPVLVIFAASSLFAPACAEDDNAAACESYVMTYNTLPCVDEDGQLAEDFCTKNNYDVYPCDVSGHFQCLESSVSCSNGALVNDGADCGIPVCN